MQVKRRTHLIILPSLFILFASFDQKTYLPVPAQDEFAHVFISYPICKSCDALQLFMNRKSIARINNGGRLDCSLLIEGSVSITLMEGKTYIEPLTQAKNTRTLTIKKGKSYYFKANGSGGLEYIMNAEKGEKEFKDSKDYSGSVASFVEVLFSPIPPLQTN